MLKALDVGSSEHIVMFVERLKFISYLLNFPCSIGYDLSDKLLKDNC